MINRWKFMIFSRFDCIRNAIMTRKDELQDMLEITFNKKWLLRERFWFIVSVTASGLETERKSFVRRTRTTSSSRVPSNRNLFWRQANSIRSLWLIEHIATLRFGNAILRIQCGRTEFPRWTDCTPQSLQVFKVHKAEEETENKRKHIY